jgi:hypothetical protein
MGKKSCIFLILSGLCVFNFIGLFAQEAPKPITAELVEKQLAKAEKDFQMALKMFDPWYAGPLLAGSAHILDAGKAGIQPYFFYTDNYAQYDRHGKSHKIPHLHQINPVFNLQVGIYDKRIDGMITCQAMYNKRQGLSSMNYMDTTLFLRYGIVPESKYYPAVLIAVRESFPTGKYNRLSAHKNGVDATGNGSYQTSVILNFGKVIWWVWTHPLSVRLSNIYTFYSSHVPVKSFNAYGGGYGTRGKVHLGNAISSDFGLEYSFTKHWVFALDMLYSFTEKATFRGALGSTASGQTASVGSPFNDQLSLAPALEYNPTADLGVIAGVWFSVWGRNSSNFVSAVASVTYTF